MISLIELTSCAPAFTRGQAIHEKAPAFEVVSPSGEKLNLEGLRGRPFVVHVWASWCEPCKKELPALAAAIKKANIPNLLYLPISVDGPAGSQKAQAALRGASPDIPIWLLLDTQESRKYWAWGVPMTYFINSTGEIIRRLSGCQNWAAFSADDMKTSFLN